MKPAVFCQTLVNVPDFLPADVTEMHKFSAISLHSNDDFGKFDELKYLRFYPKNFAVKQYCLIITRAVILGGNV